MPFFSLASAVSHLDEITSNQITKQHIKTAINTRGVSFILKQQQLKKQNLRAGNSPLQKMVSGR